MNNTIKRYIYNLFNKPIANILKVYCIFMAIALPFILLFSFFSITAVHTGNWYVSPYVIMSFIFLLISMMICAVGCVLSYQLTREDLTTIIKSNMKENLGLGDGDMKIILIKD